MDGRFPSLCDGSKTMPDGPWPMSAMGHMLAGIGDSDRVSKLLDGIAASMADNLLIPEIVDKHSGKTRSRRWFAWPPALFITSYIECICGFKVGRHITINPNVPNGWNDFDSPTIVVRGKSFKICVRNKITHVFLNGRKTRNRKFKL
jgi:glycosyl hydrolase family 125 (putative metal-dependent alpha-mannosidase)